MPLPLGEVAERSEDGEGEDGEPSDRGLKDFYLAHLPSIPYNPNKAELDFFFLYQLF